MGVCVMELRRERGRTQIDWGNFGVTKVNEETIVLCVSMHVVLVCVKMNYGYCGYRLIDLV